MPSYLIDLVASRGHRIEQRDSLASDFADLDVVYTTRIQKERFTDEMNESSRGFLTTLWSTVIFLTSAVAKARS